MHSEIPYDDTRDPRWEAAVDAIPWVRSSDETFCKRGSCPRCGHEIVFVDEGRPSDQGMFEECNCGVVHAGTPEGRIGCGANGLIERGHRGNQD